MFVRRLLSDEQKQRRVRVLGSVMYWTAMSFSEAKYSKINSIKSHVSGAGNVSECRLMSQRGSARIRVRLDQYISAVRAVEVPVVVCERSSCNHVTEDRKVCETRAESCHAKGWGLSHFRKRPT